MPTPRPPNPAAFRQQMVELVRAGRGISELAREFGCNASSIHAWVKAVGGLDGSGTTSVDAPLSINERQELIELRRKLKQVIRVERAPMRQGGVRICRRRARPATHRTAGPRARTAPRTHCARPDAPTHKPARSCRCRWRR